jgi:hypothetical protein
MEMSFVDLNSEQVEKLRQLEQELGCNLLAVEPNQTNDEQQ